MSKNFIDRFYEEDNKDRFWSLNKKIGVSLVVFFLAVIMINTTGCTQIGSNEVSVIEQPIIEENLPKEQVKVGNDGRDAAIAPDEVPDVTNEVEAVASQVPNNGEAMVSMSLDDLGRSDPFLPANEVQKVKENKKEVKPPYASTLVPPPELITVDPDATEVITTKVSGIMYDKFNPSAILNIAGADYLVRSGDLINGYKVLAIGKETVTVQHGVNVYRASVGELITGEGINHNTISNLENKFGGSNKK